MALLPPADVVRDLRFRYSIPWVRRLAPLPAAAAVVAVGKALVASPSRLLLSLFVLGLFALATAVTTTIELRLSAAELVIVKPLWSSRIPIASIRGSRRPGARGLVRVVVVTDRGDRSLSLTPGLGLDDNGDSSFLDIFHALAERRPGSRPRSLSDYVPGAPEEPEWDGLVGRLSGTCLVAPTIDGDDLVVTPDEVRYDYPDVGWKDWVALSAAVPRPLLAVGLVVLPLAVAVAGAAYAAGDHIVGVVVATVVSACVLAAALVGRRGASPGLRVTPTEFGFCRSGRWEVVPAAGLSLAPSPDGLKVVVEPASGKVVELLLPATFTTGFECRAFFEWVDRWHPDAGARSVLAGARQTYAEIDAAYEASLDEEGYDPAGYDRDGYDRKGYDDEGIDVDGRDREGRRVRDPASEPVRPDGLEGGR